MSTPFNPYWLEPRAAVPVDIETTAALLYELKRMKYLIEKTYYINEAGCTCQRLMDNLLADVARDVLERYQALNETPPCKTHPDAPHGFDRNASHSADRYVCECEGWEPPEQEPVGYAHVEDLKREHHDFYVNREQGINEVPLYTAPPKREWVGLTDKEIQAERHKVDPTAGWTYDHFARAIEAKLRGKNT